MSNYDLALIEDAWRRIIAAPPTIFTTCHDIVVFIRRFFWLELRPWCIASSWAIHKFISGFRSGQSMTTAGRYFWPRPRKFNVSSCRVGLLEVLVQRMFQQFLWDASELLIRAGYPCLNWTLTVNQALLSSFVVRDPVQADMGCTRQRMDDCSCN